MREKRVVGRIECTARMALIRPAIKLGLHWIGRTVCPGAKWIHIAEITAATMA